MLSPPCREQLEWVDGKAPELSISFSPAPEAAVTAWCTAGSSLYSDWQQNRSVTNAAEGADRQTVALPGRWKIKLCLALHVSAFILSITWEKKLFSIIFQYFQYFLHWHHECSRLFFCRERGAESIQMWNKRLLYGWALQDVTMGQTGGLLGQPRGQELLGTARIQKSE